MSYLYYNIHSAGRRLGFGLSAELWIVQLGIFLNYLGWGAVMPFEVIYLHDGRGFSLGVAGLVVGMVTGLAVVAAPVAGPVIDRFGARAPPPAPASPSPLATLGSRSRTRLRKRSSPPPSPALAMEGSIPSQSTLLASSRRRDLLHRAGAVSRVASNIGVGLGAAIGGLVGGDGLNGFVALFLATRSRTSCTSRSSPSPCGRTRGRSRSRAATGSCSATGRSSGWRSTNVAVDRSRLGRLHLDRAAVRARRDRRQLAPDRDAAARERIHRRLRSDPGRKAVGGPTPRADDGDRRAHVRRRLPARRRRGLSRVCTTPTSSSIAAVVVVGIGECFHTTVLMPLVADLAPAALRGRYMAAMGLSWWLGLALASTLGAQLLSGRRPRRCWQRPESRSRQEFRRWRSSETCRRRSA